MIPRRITRALRGITFALTTGCFFSTTTCVQTATDTLGGNFGGLPLTGLEGGGLPITEFDASPQSLGPNSGSATGNGLPGPFLR